MKRILYIALLLLSFLQVEGKGQTYPVSAFVNLTPPYSSYLPDYADPFNNQLRVLLTLNDFSIPSYTVKLRFRLEGSGYTIVNDNLLALPAFSLTPGVPIEISGNDLAPYLSSSNLTFTGIDVADYELRKVLPEGPCSICVEVVDFTNPNQAILGNPACVQAWFSLNDPPLLNMPFCGQEIPETDPQNIVFSWTPMSMGSPYGVSTEYTFELFELRPEGADPNMTVTSTLPIYTTTTTNTLLNYGIIEPPLQLGMQYIWRVRAREIDERDIYRNNGYSAVCTFTYGNIAASLADGITLELNAEGIGPRIGKAFWNTAAVFDGYRLEVRKTGNPDYAWFPYESASGMITVNSLEPETEYEARVQGLIGEDFESEWSNIATFTTYPPPNYACGSTALPGKQETIIPLTNLMVGNFVSFGQFDMQLTQVDPLGTPGHYKGYGKILVPFALTNFPVRFDDILVDENFMVREGRADALTDGLAEYINWLDREFIDGIIDDIAVDTVAGTVTVTFGDETKTFTFPENGGPLVLEDESGLIFIINPDGTITYDGNINIDNDVLAATENYQIYFLGSEDQVFGFDRFDQPKWRNHYKTIILEDGYLYTIPFKSLGENETDQCLAVFRTSGDPSSASFETSTGTSIPFELVNDSTYLLTLSGLTEDAVIYGFKGEDKIGKLKVKVYEEKLQKITLIPLAGASIGDLETAINAIYIQANLRVEIQINPTYEGLEWDLNADGLMEAPQDLGLMTKYSTEMRVLRDTYLTDSIDRESVYLFVVPGFSVPDLDGYMVRGKGLGFIVSASSGHTLAHEVCHGAFSLQHTFDEIPQGTTTNLMDYAGISATHLTASQWDDMHNPPAAFSFLDDEEDGGFSYVGIALLEPFKNDSAKSFTFFKPNGYFISLPESITQVYFSNAERFSSTNTSTTIGSLIGFYYKNGIYYKAVKFGNNSVHYKDTINNKYYIDSLSAVIKPVSGISCITYINKELGTTQDQYDYAKIITSYYEIQSPINQTVFDPDNENNYEPIIFLSASLNEVDLKSISPQEYISAIKVSEDVITHESNMKFVNSSLLNISQYGFFGDDRNAYTFLMNEFDQTTTLFDYLLFYDFVNSPLLELINRLNCLNEIIQYENGVVGFYIEEKKELVYEDNPITELRSYQDLISESINRYNKINEWEYLELDETVLELILEEADSYGYTCFFEALTSQKRIELMEAVIKNDNLWAFHNSLLLSEIYKSGNTEDKHQIIKNLRDKNWLIEISNQLNEWTDVRDDKDFDAIQDFFNTIKPEYFSIYTSLDLTQSTKEIAIEANEETLIFNEAPPSALHPSAPVFLSLPTTYSLVQNYNEFPIFVGTKKGILELTNEPPTSLSESTYADIFENEIPFHLSNNNRIIVEGNYNLASFPKNVIPYNPLSEIKKDENIFFRNTSEYSLDPLELIEVVFTSTYGSMDFEENQSIVIPAFQLVLIDKAIELHKVNWISRVVLDGLEIVVGAIAYVSAPATCGGSIAAFTAIVAAIDAAITLQRENSASLSDYNNGFYQGWDAFKSIVDVSFLAASAPKILAALAKLPKSLIKKSKAIFIAQLMNYYIKKTPLVIDDIPYSLKPKTTLYYESIRIGKSLDEIPEFTTVFDDWIGSGLMSKIDEIDAVSPGLKTKFIDDFNTAPLEVKALLNTNNELVDAWEKLSHLPQSVRTNPTNLFQRSLLDEYADGIASASNARKGNFGEIGADLDLNTKGYNSLVDRIDNIDSPGHNGLDGVFEKNGQYYVVEGKYTGSASLNSANEATGLPRQMSDDWISTRDWSVVNLDPGIIQNLLDTKNYTRLLAKVAPDGSVTYRLIDSDGYVITGNTGIFNP